MNSIEVTNLSFSYTPEIDVLKGIHLKLDGETTAIVGQNGAGKSTFVKLLKGLLRPTEGEILLNGKNTKDYTVASLAKEIGLVFQNPNDQIFKNTVIGEVMFGPLNIGQDEQKAKEKSIEALEKVHLEKYLETNPYDLSLSERKLIAIASILSMDPNIVIFDEPTMGQDYAGKETLKEIIFELRNQGKLVLCILHDMDFAAEVFERTIVFNQGKVLIEGPSRDIFAQKEILEQAYLEQPYVAQIADELGLKGSYATDEDLLRALKEE
ncbi:energy-coupling factor transport system ATP-binding protein [Salinibacillus kushneri]|uniref:Energy-coupling factor transport system ATP-binding protein n=1 Tax=Salinibacillus kushneri TaxID=237682 RepID=A0A1H9ZG11_9BACI|nr:ABC transporter ATP-binding protein [Salinibacillus kushneri]SES80548.1 energy-coupling factor transport system ATP-binding protein [Salinibacillus kushneri]